MAMNPVLDLNRLLRPASIAVVGGSWSRSVIEQSLLMQFSGEIWPVHPQHHEIGGQKCYRSLSELPAAPDAVFIGVNRHTTIELVRQLSASGAGGAVCFASGFSEASAEDAAGSELQQQLVQAAGNMPVLGPNCYGLINYLDGALLWPDQHGGQRVDRGVALITQSSNIAINMTMQRRALPIAYVMTAGNQACVSIADIGLALLDDERVTALGLHIEGIADIRGFEQLAAKAHSLGKGIVAIKVGRSVNAQTAMVSHTNSLSGSDTASDALLKRLGISRVDSIPVLLETLKLLHLFGPLPGNSIASMSCSGGEAGIMADALEGRPLEFAPLKPAQLAALRDSLGPMVALANPLDYHTYIWNDLAKMTATFSAVMRDGADLSFLVIDFPRDDRCEYDSWLVAIEALVAARDDTGARVALLASLHENMPESIAESLMKKNIPCFSCIDEALDATVAAASTGRLQNNTQSTAVLLQPPVMEEPRLLSESQAKKVLHKAGLIVPDSRTVGGVAEAVDAAKIIGFPVVAKVTGVAHKTESGGVVLNLQTAEDTQRAVAKLLGFSELVLVEKYITDTVAELLVGVVREPDNTFLLTLAAGGLYTELLSDYVSLLLPVDQEQIKSALGLLKINAMLTGYRGRAGADIVAIADAIEKLSDWVIDNASLVEEIEINPLICLPDQAVVADALIRMRIT